jgi:cysteinyl-tRNA synthetase
MNLKHLGQQIDIHGGGSDLVFPHHENEIAQTESMTGKPFARYWMHNGMLQIQTKLADGTTKMEKMSKSLGNVVTIESFLAEHEADVLRLIVLSSYYRSPLAYGTEIVADQERKLARLRSALAPAVGSHEAGSIVEVLAAATDLAREHFIEAMDDDFNTASALAALFELVRAVNVARDAGVGSVALGRAQAVLRELAGVLGLTFERSRNQAQEAAPFIELLIELRAELRKAKQYALADSVRNRLLDLEIVLEDGPQGTRWKVK